MTQTPFLNFTASACIDAAAASSYLVLDLGSESMIYAVTTRGSSSAANWVISYKIQYSAYDTSNWRTVINADGTDRVFSGNTDQNTEVSNDMPVGIVGNKIRLVPVTSNGRADVRIAVKACKMPRKLRLWLCLIFSILLKHYCTWEQQDIYVCIGAYFATETY